MKKTFIVLMMVLLSLMLFVSCDNRTKEPETKRYKVTFNVNGGTGTFVSQSVEEGEKAERPDTDPKSENKYETFKFWSADEVNEFKFEETTITGDIELKAIYRDLTVGDTGPAGGIIFYDVDSDNGNDANDGLVSGICGWRYLEAAASDASFTDSSGNVDYTYAWGPDTSGTSYTTDTGIGKGKPNTELILNRTEEFAAFQACADYGNDTDYDDWFLPSKDELNLMYTNLAAKGLGGTWGHVFPNYTQNKYWSSSEEDAWSSRWALDFSNGAQEDWGGKGNWFCVRPVRSF